MLKSSRFWWLHGAILFAAVAGCNRNCTNGGGGCGPGMNPSPYSGGTVGGPMGSASATMYQQGGATPGIPSGGAFPSSANSGGYSMPGLSSGMSQQSLGGARP